MADKQEDQAKYLEMSDEEMMAAAVPVMDEQPAEESESEGELPDGDEPEGASGEAPADPDGTEGEGDDKEDRPDDELGDPPTEEVKDEKEPAKSKAKAKEEEKPEAGKDEKPKEVEIDYQAEYSRLLAPFKANGRDIQIKSVDEAITLMQMGANYNKKMAALKPNLKLLKMLENNKLLDESKISFLIDLDKKDPAAINKLISDSKIDPMDLDADKAGDYKQATYTVSDTEIELESVLDEIESTSTYKRTLDIVTNKWDAASKQSIAGNPNALRTLNNHVASGIYDIISAEVDNERLFNRLNGLSDLDAYRQVGDAIEARGGFNHLFQGSSSDKKETLPAGTVVTPKPKKEESDKLNDKRRAASPTRAGTPKAKPDFSPLGLSDEEFAKQGLQQFL